MTDEPAMEQANGSNMENYVHRTEELGARVLITRIWY